MFYKIKNNRLIGFFSEKEEEDFFEISIEEHERLMKGQEKGKSIVYKNGKLILIEPEETLTKEPLILLRKNKIVEYEKPEGEKNCLKEVSFHQKMK